MTITKETILACLIVGAIAFYFGRNSAEPTGAKNFDDCLLDVLKSGTADMVAIHAARQACGRKFGSP